MIRVLIADDHAIVRRGLRELLGETSDIQATAEATNGHEVLEKVREDDFDVLLLDISMPGKNGIDVLKDLRAEKQALPVLILSMYPEEQYAVRALKAGASGYLAKDVAPESLIDAIRKVHSGGRYITSTLAERLVLELSTQNRKDLHLRLSDREYEVMRGIASGKTVSEIATDLSLSTKTVSTYRDRTLKKMGMKTNAQLTHYAISRGLVG
ncbi:MAG: response regulator [Fidelibacterota bacterium]